jgi:hypothetical protein
MPEKQAKDNEEIQTEESTERRDLEEKEPQEVAFRTRVLAWIGCGLGRSRDRW